MRLHFLSIAWGDCVAHALLLPCRHGALARLLPMTGGAAALPGVFAPCTGHQPYGFGGVTLRMLGRCGGHGLTPPG